MAPRDVVARTESSAEPVLLQRLRGGDDAAFGELFESHAAAVRRLALGLAADRSEAEDITAETFFRVLQALRRGNGPRDNVRAYLLTVARRVSWEWHGARRDVPVTDDELTTRAGAGGDSQARAAEHTLITRAFSSLPERWRTVLWQTEVEGEQPAVVAPHFGLSANATAALARRARLGLRAAYLQAHLAVHRSSDGCRTVMEKLGGYTAGSVTGAEARKIKAHLIICSSCRSTHAELRDVCSSLRAHAGVLVLMVPASALAFGTTSGAGIGTAGSAVAASAAAGGAGGAAAGGFGGVAIAIGTKVKVGVALASTAAAGAFGVAIGPVVDSDTAQTIGLPGRGAELRIAESTTSMPSPRIVDGTAVAAPGHDPLDRGNGDAQPPAHEYRPAQGMELNSEAGRHDPALDSETGSTGGGTDGTQGNQPPTEDTNVESRIDRPDNTSESPDVVDSSTGSSSPTPSDGMTTTSGDRERTDRASEQTHKPRQPRGRAQASKSRADSRNDSAVAGDRSRSASTTSYSSYSYYSYSYYSYSRRDDRRVESSRSDVTEREDRGCRNAPTG